MTIAEKLTRAKADTDEAYDAGFAAGQAEGEASVFVPSKYCRSIQFHDLNLFGTETVIVNLDNAWSLTNLFYLIDRNGKAIANTTVKHFILNIKEPLKELVRCFGTVEYLERVTMNVDFSQMATLTNPFWSCPDLKVVDGTPWDMSTFKANDYFIYQGANLQEVRFVAGTMKVSINFSSCKSFSAETIQSIVDGLADLTGQTVQTITFHADVGAKLTDAQKATITAKNWTFVY